MKINNLIKMIKLITYPAIYLKKIKIKILIIYKFLKVEDISIYYLNYIVLVGIYMYNLDIQEVEILQN